MQPNILLTCRDGGSKFDAGHEQVELKVRICSSFVTSHDFVFKENGFVRYTLTYTCTSICAHIFKHKK